MSTRAILSVSVAALLCAAITTHATAAEDLMNLQLAVPAGFVNRGIEDRQARCVERQKIEARMSPAAAVGFCSCLNVDAAKAMRGAKTFADLNRWMEADMAERDRLVHNDAAARARYQAAADRCMGEQRTASSK